MTEPTRLTEAELPEFVNLHERVSFAIRAHLLAYDGNVNDALLDKAASEAVAAAWKVLAEDARSRQQTREHLKVVS